VRGFLLAVGFGTYRETKKIRISREKTQGYTLMLHKPENIFKIIVS